ncbi:unnamed protein product [Closterium sp. Yama58-4]|nr:unnamed protein product [Closterium sp. Yama58-4]
MLWPACTVGMGEEAEPGLSPSRFSFSRLSCPPLPSPAFPFRPLPSPSVPCPPLPSPALPFRTLPSPSVPCPPLPSPAFPFRPLPSPSLSLVLSFPLLRPPLSSPDPPFPPFPCAPLPYSALPSSSLPSPALPCPPLPSPALPCTPLLSPALPCTPLPSPALPCPPLPSPALPCTPLPSPALPCPPLHSPALPCPPLHSPALPCPPLHSPALPCTPLPSPALPCTPLPSPALPCAPLPSPALPCAPLPSPALPCPPLRSPALPCPPLPCPGLRSPPRLALPTLPSTPSHMERRDLLRAAAAPFNRTLHTAALPSIMLDYYELQPHLGARLRCRGPPCPKFGHCGPSFPHIQACWNDHLTDPRPLFPADPLNCPRLQVRKFFGLKPVEDVGKLRRPWYYIDKQCSHRVDVNARDATAMQVFKMSDVYSAFGGYVFNLTHRFNRNGCKRFLKVTLTPNMTLYHLKSVFNWDYRQAGNFYHFIIEAVPLLYAAARLLPSLLPDTPIAAKGDQVIRRALVPTFFFFSVLTALSVPLRRCLRCRLLPSLPPDIPIVAKSDQVPFSLPSSSSSLS